MGDSLQTVICGRVPSCNPKVTSVTTDARKKPLVNRREGERVRQGERKRAKEPEEAGTGTETESKTERGTETEWKRERRGRHRGRGEGGQGGDGEGERVHSRVPHLRVALMKNTRAYHAPARIASHATTRSTPLSAATSCLMPYFRAGSCRILELARAVF